MRARLGVESANEQALIALNRAVAIAMRDGPEEGLAAIDAILGAGHLEGYHLAHAARGDMHRRLGNREEAITSYQAALGLTQQVADWLQTTLGPRGVGVVIEAEHLCMTMRGVRAGGVTTVTSAVQGHLREDAAARAEFFALALPSRPDRRRR